MTNTTRKMRLAGTILSAAVTLVMLADGVMTLVCPPPLQEEMRATGFDVASHVAVGMIGLVATLLYALPRTAVLGAILLTGFLGGAICTHFRLEGLGTTPVQWVSLLLGIGAWGGLWLRDARVRALIPLRD